jgi:hypothetical protein
MKCFLIEFKYEGSNCECFVEKLICEKEELFLLSFKEASLIKRFKGKRLLLSAENRKDRSVEMVWSAIKQQEPDV